ncbi:hypothetical protein TNCV_4542471 [Trichonephila clavipes]|nr:hypothetical protein TNCV_4542471 [Trichonephila clavipes]
MSRCSSQVVSLTRTPSVKFPRKLGTHLSTHQRDERLNRPSPAWDLNLGPVVGKRDALTTQPLGLVFDLVLID